MGKLCYATNVGVFENAMVIAFSSLIAILQHIIYFIYQQCGIISLP